SPFFILFSSDSVRFGLREVKGKHTIFSTLFDICPILGQIKLPSRSLGQAHHVGSAEEASGFSTSSRSARNASYRSCASVPSTLVSKRSSEPLCRLCTTSSSK